MEAMKKARELDKEQEHLQWERQMLVVKTEIEMNEAQMNLLEGYQEAGSVHSHDGTSTNKSIDNVREWLKLQST